MDPIQQIHSFETIKILADSRRLEILRLLMNKPATLSDLGQMIGEHPAQVRHHLKQLEKVGLVELVDTRVVRGFVAKYYRAKARAFIFQEMILPENPEKNAIPVLGSHDLALEAVSNHLQQKENAQLNLIMLPIGSLDGLIALRQGRARIAGCHLLDVESGEYNIPFVRHLFPEQDIALVTLAHREQGLIITKGNPKQITSLQDLIRDNIRMVNRNKGSGTRLWLDGTLSNLALPSENLRGYKQEVQTHTAVAQAVLEGRADVGLGLQAAASKLDLDFVPLFQERFDLVLFEEQLEDKRIAPLFDFLNSAAFRKIVQNLGGYQTEHSGEKLSP